MVAAGLIRNPALTPYEESTLCDWLSANHRSPPYWKTAN